MLRDVIFNEEAQDGMKKGVDILARAVKSTLGPMGRNVTIQEMRKSPGFTKDGVTVASHVNLPDGVSDQGAQLVKQAAKETMIEAGDGTTTSIVLAEAIYKEGLLAVSNTVNPVRLNRGIDIARDAISEFIVRNSTVVKSKDDLVKVATIASNNDVNLGQLIGKTIDRIGENGVVVVQEGWDDKDTVEFVKGFQLDSGVIHFYHFSQGRTTEIEIQEPLVIAVPERISSEAVISEMLKVARDRDQPLIVIAEDFELVVIKKMLNAREQYGVVSFPVKAQDFGEFRKFVIEDACIISGCKYIGHLGIDIKKIKASKAADSKGAHSWAEFVGSCDKAFLSMTQTKLVFNEFSEERQEQIGNRLSQIEIQMKEAEKEGNDYVSDKAQKRFARLSGGIASLKIHAESESHMKQKKARVEDSLFATKSAVEKGIQPGCGMVFLRASNELKFEKAHPDVELGIRIVMKALSEPFRTIFENAGIEKIDDYMKEALSGGYWDGFDLNGNEEELSLVNLREAGVIDTTKVLLAAIKHSTNVAKLLLTTDVVIVNTEKQDKDLLEEMKRKAMQAQ